MKVGSLFSGIGGFDLGLERAGMEIAWQVEIDDRCFQFLERAWLGVKRFRDVRECGKHNLSPVDLITAGVPCQPASRAGKQRGSEDVRWLWPEALRIIHELNPAWAILENPPGIGDVGLSRILTDLAAQGYERRVFGIPACSIGSPQIRQRYFIVAHATEKGYRLSGSGARQSSMPQSYGQGDMANTRYGHKGGTQTERREKRGSDQGGLGRVGNVADTEETTRIRLQDREEPEPSTQNRRCDSDFWRDYVWVPCADGKVRRAPDDSFGLVDGLHRSLLAALGNSVLPQVVEAIGRAIIEAEGRTS